MSANDDLLVAFELHDPQGIRKAFQAGRVTGSPEKRSESICLRALTDTLGPE